MSFVDQETASGRAVGASPRIAALPGRGLLVQRRLSFDGSRFMIVSVAVGLLLVALTLGRFIAFFNVDGDVTYLGALSLTHHWLSAGIPYPFAHADPAGRYTLPLTAWIDHQQFAGYSLPFEYVTAAFIALFGQAGILAPSLLGTAGIMLVQLRLASLLGLTERRALLVTATVITTPIVFYALVYSAHTSAVALLLAGMAVLLPERSVPAGRRGVPRGRPRESSRLTVQRSERTAAQSTSGIRLLSSRRKATRPHDPGVGLGLWRRLTADISPVVVGRGFAAGGLFAMATLMRREVVIPALAALVLAPIISLLASRDRGRGRTTPEYDRRTAAGEPHADRPSTAPVQHSTLNLQPSTLILPLAGLIALVIPLGIIWLLHPEPLILGLTHASPGRAGVAPGATASHLRRIEWLTAGGYATGLLIAITGLLVLVRFRRSGWLVPMFALGSVAVAGAYTVQLLTNAGEATDNPLAFSPLCLWGVWSLLCTPASRRHATQWALWAIGLGGSGAVILAAYDYGGAWGARYILFVFPLLVALAFLARQDLKGMAAGWIQGRMVEYSFILLLVVGTLLQGIGIMAVAVGKQQVTTAENRIAALPTRTIVSDDPTVAALAPLYSRRTILFASNQGSLDRLMGLLRRRGTSPVAVVCGPRLYEQFKVKCTWSYSGWSHDAVRHGKLLGYALYRRAARAA